jgi:hypothetical protein
MTSHREAPSISNDPAADNTDLYAFVSPDAPSTITFISNFVPMQEPAGGPNFAKFGEDVLYEILVDNDADGKEEITFQFNFGTTVLNSGTFLYNVGPISFDPSSGNYKNLNVIQTYTLTLVTGDRRTGQKSVIASGLLSPPVNVGPRSTPNYGTNLVPPAIYTLPNGWKVFAGQRADGFYVDLGSIFDLGTLRPFENLHLISTPAAPGVDGTKGFNVHSIALQVPISAVTKSGQTPSSVNDPAATIGVWTTASRRKVRILDTGIATGPYSQVSRLGNPLINEVIIPLGSKDYWNTSFPSNDAQFLNYYNDPGLQNLLPVLYPNVFPNLATLLQTPPASRPRADLAAILLTGIPAGIISGFQNFTGATPADMLRLNLAIPPALSTTNPASDSKARFGILGGDLSGFPNGRRVFDNVTAVELRALAGATYGLVASYTPDGAASLLTDGTTNDQPYLEKFPYLATPYQGYAHLHDPEDE